ncbi:MAG: succinate--CoA ligase subunit alpha [Candidatus Neomarinimicrobiota bacterium]|nr:succinate--CoA ligase subunit alpha [Candidatus Neomarinimicrobiota bacterium]MEC9007306.1 succinate--CoA ligase subunit alpha [Candidatus Neomarinimicrobiota bacterium]MEC9436706.1 succinate--CoA ligase subunit alpha [Candidatus Neomarinimicrobiota bacterium]MEC9474487.1 succinate--CoA ligase subunit alpha [Candidatus Neomarinimicrobiota bacterium]MED5434127.1 succinate--CoA ligase subunit alpha [Candidatus Neomarinimicrobiota bacterium]|tara:strand:+ start:107 stop:979 length:873 start_codon:yes stop_codon:yes gene_type:complete
MSIIVNKDSKVIVQGITGSEGSFHASEMLAYGTNIVGGVTPGKGGSKAIDGKVLVYNSVEEAKNATNADVSIIFVPPPFAAEAIIEASEAGIEVVVCISEGIPIRDMTLAKRVVDQNNTRLIGPNCPGIITVEECKLGIMPGFICKKGNIGVVSKSGTLTYEAIGQLVDAGLGQTTAIGIGGDPIIGTTMIDILDLFEKDNETEGVVLIGEIGGQMENDAARWVKENMSKPVVGFIAGQTAPEGRRMGHAGAIVSGGDDTAEAKMKIMKDCGIIVCESVAEIGEKMKKAI